MAGFSEGICPMLRTDAIQRYALSDEFIRKWCGGGCSPICGPLLQEELEKMGNKGGRRMAGRKETAPETAAGGVVGEAAAAPPAKMEFRLISPTEDGFLRVIKWNREELEAAVRQKIASYENVAYTEDNMKQAKADRAELNRLTKAIDERRKMVKKIINGPYDVFEAELKEILALIQEPVGIIDRQVKAFEDWQREEKKKGIQAAYDDAIGDLSNILPFEKIFDIRYLNKTYKLATAQADVRAKIEKVRADLETIDSLESKYRLNAKDAYIKTLDLSKALAENKRLHELEEKLEAEKRRKAAEEAERKRQEAEREAERRRLAEEMEAERKRQEEERRRLEEERARNLEAQKKADQELASRQQESVAKPVGNVSNGAENVPESRESVSGQWHNIAESQESVSAPPPGNGRAIQGAGQQPYVAAVDPFARQQAAGQPKAQEKRYQTRFYAKGTRGQLEKLVQFMDDNGIEYGRIKA